MPALALVKAGIFMPSHSLRFAGATPTEGTKAVTDLAEGTKVVTDLGHNYAQANPNAGQIYPESWAEFCAAFFGNGGGFLGEKLTNCRADFTCSLGGIMPNEGRKF